MFLKNIYFVWFCLQISAAVVWAEEISPSDTILAFQSKPARFTAKDGTKAVLYISKNQLRIGFFPVGKKMYSFPGNIYFNTRKGHLSKLIELTGFYYQDKNGKKPEFVLSSMGYGGATLIVFAWNGHLFAPLPYCPGDFHWGARSIERRISEDLGEDYFVFTYNNGTKKAFYARNHFLVLGNDSLLKTEEKPRAVKPDLLELNNLVAKGDWVGALAAAKKKIKDGPFGKARMQWPWMIPLIHVEEGNPGGALPDFLSDEKGQYNEKFISSEQLAQSYEGVGDQLITDGKLDAAKWFYEKAVTNYEKWLERIKTIDGSILKGPLPQNVSKKDGEAYMKQFKKSSASSFDQQKNNIDRVKQKIEMAEEQGEK